MAKRTQENQRICEDTVIVQSSITKIKSVDQFDFKIHHTAAT